MFSLISTLTTLPPLPRPQLLAQTSAIAGGQRGGHTVARTRDVFASTLGASHAAGIGALTKAAGNARAGASLLQTADLGLDAIDAALTTMKALATQASSTTTPLSRGERAILNAEFQQLRTEIDRIADETEFNGIKVLKGVTTVEESIETVTQSYSITNLGSKIGVDDGFQDFVIASSPNGVSDGDRIRIEYDKQTGLFSVTNITTSQAATVAAPASAPSEGQTTDVVVSEFSLTIQVNSNFNPNQSNKAPPGNPGQNEFLVSVTTSTTTTTVTSTNVAQVIFQVGTGTADQDKITLTLPAATIADLESGLASDDLAAASGASQALTDVTNAIDALHSIQASLEGSLVGFLGAAQNLTLSESVLTNLRTGLLDKPATLETAERLARSVSKEILKPAAPAIAGRVSAAMGALLSSARLQPLEPAQAPVQAPVPEKTGDEVAPRPWASRAAHDTESPSRREPYQSLDVEV